MNGWENTKSWTTKNGTVVSIADMSDGHLDNTVAMLDRNPRVKALARAFAYEYLPSMYAYAATAPDGAAMAVESEIRQIELGEVSLHHIPVYAALKEEQENRRR